MPIHAKFNSKLNLHLNSQDRKMKISSINYWGSGTILVKSEDQWFHTHRSSIIYWSMIILLWRRFSVSGALLALGASTDYYYYDRGHSSSFISYMHLSAAFIYIYMHLSAQKFLLLHVYSLFIFLFLFCLMCQCQPTKSNSAKWLINWEFYSILNIFIMILTPYVKSDPGHIGIELKR